MQFTVSQRFFFDAAHTLKREIEAEAAAASTATPTGPKSVLPARAIPSPAWSSTWALSAPRCKRCASA